MTTNVVVAFDIGEHNIAKIAAADPSLDVRFLDRSVFEKPERLRAELADAEVIFTLWGGRWAPVQDLREWAPNVKWVQLTSAGADRVGVLHEAGVMVTTAAGANAIPIAEMVMAYILMFAKGWPQLFRNQQAHSYARFMPGELPGKTVGIVGMGHVGIEVARLSRAFGCRVVATRRSFTQRGTHELLDEALPPSDLHVLLGESDFVVVAAALTEETRGLIDAERLAQMKPSAYLINISRGDLIDEPALVETLRAGVIAGAALDVTHEEPLPADSPLWDFDNVLLTPHLSGGSPLLYDRGTDIFCDNLRRYLAGEPLQNLVDPARGY